MVDGHIIAENVPLIDAVLLDAVLFEVMTTPLSVPIRVEAIPAGASKSVEKIDMLAWHPGPT